MEARRWFAASLDGMGVAFPEEEVRMILPWMAPRPMPRAARWLLGWLPHDGEVLPVARPGALGTAAADCDPDILLVLRSEGFSLGLGGRDAKVILASLVPGDLPPPFMGEVAGERGERFAATDLSRLYSAFGMGYNATG